MPWYIQGLIVFGIVYFFLKETTFKIKGINLSKLYLITITVFSLIWSFSYIYKNFEKPSEWDFLCWYLSGNVASEGLNFYEAESYKKEFKTLQVPFKPSTSFVKEVVDVGFNKYPPPTMLYLVPLGFFNYFDAQILWTFFNIILAFLCLYYIWKIYFNEVNWKIILVIISLFCLHQGTRSNLDHQQNILILLLMVLLTWRDRKLARAGIWIALGIIAKPLMAIIAIYLIFKKNWSGLFVSVLSFVGLILISALFFGPDIVVSYFLNNLNSNVPNGNYVESVNISLLSVILRATNYDISLYSPLFNPLFLTIVFLISSITIGFIYLLENQNKSLNEEWSYSFFIILSLLIYPATKSFYSILLIPMIFLIIKDRSLFANKFLPQAFIVASIYSLMQIQNNFIVHASVWLFLNGLFLSKIKFPFALRTGVIKS